MILTDPSGKSVTPLCLSTVMSSGQSGRYTKSSFPSSLGGPSCVNLSVGLAVGLTVGLDVTLIDGLEEGEPVGLKEGDDDGLSVGLAEGEFDGLLVGSSVHRTSSSQGITIRHEHDS